MTIKILTCVLVSVYHTKAEDKFIYFWRPDEKGYTKDLTNAGRYNIYANNERYNNMRTMSLDVNGEDYSKLERVIDEDHVSVKNNAFNRRVLGLSIDGRGLKRGI